MIDVIGGKITERAERSKGNAHPPAQTLHLLRNQDQEYGTAAQRKREGAAAGRDVCVCMPVPMWREQSALHSPLPTETCKHSAAPTQANKVTS